MYPTPAMFSPTGAGERARGSRSCPAAGSGTQSAVATAAASNSADFLPSARAGAAEAAGNTADFPSTTRFTAPFRFKSNETGAKQTDPRSAPSCHAPGRIEKTRPAPVLVLAYVILPRADQLVARFPAGGSRLAGIIGHGLHRLYLADEFIDVPAYRTGENLDRHHDAVGVDYEASALIEPRRSLPHPVRARNLAARIGADRVTHVLDGWGSLLPHPVGEFRVRADRYDLDVQLPELIVLVRNCG